MQHNRRILFVTIPEKGHINPMIGIAQELESLGYEIAFFAQADLTDQLVKAGLNVPVFFDASPQPSFITKGKDFVEKLQDKAWLQNWIKTLLIDAVPKQIILLRQIIKTYQPALIVADPMVYAAAIVADEFKIPWAGVASSLNPITPLHWTCDLTETLKLYNRERQVLFTNVSHKIEFRVSDLISPWLNIVFSTEEYIPRHLSQNNFSFYVGHSFPKENRGDEQDFPFHLLRDCKKVYMSLGSQVYCFPHIFEVVQEVFRGVDIQLILSINELINTPFRESLHENVIAVSYAPQLKILPLVDLMISHGGANSVLECLAHRKPIALLPVCNDQFLQAEFVKMNKVGRVLDITKPDVLVYKKHLTDLLSESSEERQNAMRIGESFLNHQGPSEAAALIQELFITQKPLMPSTNILHE